MKKITGGKRIENNLFYLLQNFSISENSSALLEYDKEIENVFIYVVGQQISTIEGLLKTTNKANLFLINPNGIIFDANASLDIGDSFTATTANKIKFDDNKILTFKEDGKLLLKKNVPSQLILDSNNGSIVINGCENQITESSTFSPVKFEQKLSHFFTNKLESLALISNKLHLDRGVIEGKNIHLISLESGIVDITHSKFEVVPDSFELRYQDINLDRQSLVNSNSEESGNINLTGRNINVTNGSFILIQNKSDSSNRFITIKASEKLAVSGHHQPSKLCSTIRSESLNEQVGAAINIFAQNLELQDGGRIRTFSFDRGKGGNISSNISGTSSFYKGSIIATTLKQGNAGNISLSAQRLYLNLAGICSSTFGDGNGGIINIDSDLIEVFGNEAGERGSIAATSFALGDAGSLTINTSRVKVSEGASLSSSCFASGNAGSVTINASKSVEVIGQRTNTSVGKNPQTTLRAAVQAVSSGGQKAYGLPAIPSGNSGYLFIKSPFLSIIQEGIITVENQGTGKAGKLKIDVDLLEIDQGKIVATASEDRGEITIKTSEIINKNSSLVES